LYEKEQVVDSISRFLVTEQGSRVQKCIFHNRWSSSFYINVYFTMLWNQILPREKFGKMAGVFSLISALKFGKVEGFV